ncbi:hypothetical protein AJ80_04258 [Polytolypa hystricis UAMH7299]|uniref:Cellular morphogenesis protein n=1 Tax=Polytolypa hystricis (strain UAMH7299) TaxID=1447883 RepID=A0A2B7YCZ3_POLH7|nr:hypothetical protein AJ80_04258 [Polytolypa hystricis UAMH7299]
MRFASLLKPAAAGIDNILRLSALLAILDLSTQCTALFTPVSLPNLDLGPLGRIALAGNFDAISLYLYEEQQQSLSINNASHSQSLLMPLPNGALATLASADADILAMCPLVADNGTVTSVIIGGNFTSLERIESQGIASFDPATGLVTAIPGLSGRVMSLYCDQETDTVYVGGDFKRGNSTNAIGWSAKSGFSNLPFAGFNGPVTSIVKSDNGRIVFGGSFDGLGNTTTPSQKDQQIINLEAARITATSSSGIAGFTEPRNAICNGNSQDSAGNAWLLADQTPGFWRAEMNFGFEPTKLRLWNTHREGRGTKTFRFTALPDTGILNMTYTDPASGDTVACDARCPLSDDEDEKFRDFHFVNVVGMNGFQLDISDWYGSGGGFDGIELFQDDIFVYAINDFNEPRCADVEFGSKATATGNWRTTPSGQSSSDYLSVRAASDEKPSVSVTFEPDIKQSGNYSVTLYTPGCIQDNSCTTRGIVNVTATFSGQGSKPIQTTVFQTNNFDKYDQIYLGHVDANSGNFRATVNLSPARGQGTIDAVASRIRFELISSTGGLNGLYEFDPSQKSVSTDFTDSALNRAGNSLDSGASISSLVWDDGVLFAAGKFSNSSYSNIMSFSDDKVTSLPDGGLNSLVTSLLLVDDLLFIGGNFSNTAKGDKEKKLRNVAAYSRTSESWVPLGAGVDGRVTSLASFPLNITADKTEVTVAVSGDFKHILAVEDKPEIAVSGFAVWVPSRKQWLQHLDVDQSAFYGKLTSSLEVLNTTLLAGSLVTGGIASRGAASLVEDNDVLLLRPLPIDIQQTQPERPSRKRATSDQDVTGVITGIFDKGSDRNLTILAGHFAARSTNGSTIENLLFLDGSNDDTVSGPGPGVDSESTFITIALQGDSLFAGGSVTGRIADTDVNGLVVYDLANTQYSSDQPPRLEGGVVVVNTIAPRPDTSEVYVGGQFESARSLPCPSVCNYQTESNQWIRPGDGLRGTVSVLRWSNKENLIAAGNLTVNGNSAMLASYDTEAQTWSAFNVNSTIPGPVTALCPAREDGSLFWIAGETSSGSSFITFYDGSTFHLIDNLFSDGTTIHGLQILGLSEDHEETDFLDKDQVLMISGQLQIPKFGTASAALYNGTTLIPFIITTTADGEPGSIAELFTENKNVLKGGRRGRPRGIVILVSFCFALACVFLIVVIGIILARIQRYRQGYVRAPQGTDRRPDLQRVPPEYLLDSLRQRAPGAPVI